MILYGLVFTYSLPSIWIIFIVFNVDLLKYFLEDMVEGQECFISYPTVTVYMHFLWVNLFIVLVCDLGNFPWKSKDFNKKNLYTILPAKLEEKGKERHKCRERENVMDDLIQLLSDVITGCLSLLWSVF